jgi:hypothetical protein
MVTFKKRSIKVYIIGVAIALAIVISVAWFTQSREHFKIITVFCCGYGLGMLAMWIAVHVYRWNGS